MRKCETGENSNCNWNAVSAEVATRKPASHTLSISDASAERACTRQQHKQPLDGHVQRAALPIQKCKEAAHAGFHALAAIVIAYNAVQSVGSQPTFRRNISPPSSRCKNTPVSSSAYSSSLKEEEATSHDSQRNTRQDWTFQTSCHMSGSYYILPCSPYHIVLSKAGPPLWSSGQTSWLQIQRTGFDSRRHHIFWEVVGLERGPLSLVSTTEELLGRKKVVALV
jgi:hypothetical protein